MRRTVVFALLLVASTGILAAGCVSDGNGGSATSTPEATAQPTQQRTPPASTTPGGSAIDENLPPVLRAREAIATELERDVGEVRAVSLEQRVFPDTCLDVINQPDEVCAPVETPGYRIGVRLAQTVYYFHTNLDGSILRLAGIDVQHATPASTPG